MRTFRIAALGLALAVSAFAGPPCEPGPPPWDTTPGAPFDGWNVTVEPHANAGGDPQILTLAFDSEVLGQRVENVVWVPDVYCEAPASLPVVYYLHGTVSFTFPDLIPPTGSATGPGSMSFRERLGDMTFLVIGVDSQAPPWCINCDWDDGIDGVGVLADTHLHDELFPLVEAVFATRSDRNGRGVVGHSMGGAGALIQGFRHPDTYAFVGSSSGTMTVLDDFASIGPFRWLVWTRFQGFGLYPTHEIHYRNINLLDIAPNTVGSGMEIVAVIGDGCVDPGTVDTGSCQDPDFTDVLNWSQEVYQRNLNNDFIAPRLVEAGVPMTFIQREGMHGISGSTFARYFLDRLNHVFAVGVPTPTTFSYKTSDHEFSIWGWEFAVERPNDEFLNVLGGRLDGRGVVLAGTGVATVTTPGTFAPGETYRVVTTPQDRLRVGTDHFVEADGDGRLMITIELGPTRDYDEHSLLVDLGELHFPDTRIEVFDVP